MTYPIVENFDRGSLLSPTWDVAGGIVINLISSSNGGIGEYSLRASGAATGNFYSGYATAYIGRGSQDWTRYTYLKLMLNNRGNVGDKITLAIFDNDNPDYSGSVGHDEWTYTLPMYWTNQWREIYIPLNAFEKDKSVGNGDGILNLAPKVDAIYTYPGVYSVGISFVSRTSTGSVTVDIDELLLTNRTSTTDVDLDGLADNWEYAYFGNLTPTTNGNPDHDKYSYIYDFLNLQEQLNGTNPAQPNIFPTIENFENTGIVWTTANNLNKSSVVFSNPSINNAMRLTGTAPGAYYVGFAGADISDPMADWSQYRSLKFMAFNSGKLGDQIKLQITDKDGDKWEFAQVMNATTVGTWNYFTVVLTRNLFTNANLSGPNTFDFSPSSNGAPGVTYFGLSLVSKTPTGTVDMVVDNFELSTQPISNDGDGDGLMGDWEAANGLNDFSAASPNGTNDDPDGDGYTNLEEQSFGFDPQGRNPYFPMIDDFGDLNYTKNPTWNIAGVNPSISGTPGNYALTVTGSATGNYFIGYASTYIGNSYFDYTPYKYFKMVINNRGNAGDKIKIEIFDNHALTWNVNTNVGGTSEKHVFETTISKGQKELDIPFTAFSVTGNSLGGQLNLAPSQNFPGIMMIGIAFISAAPTGSVTMDISNIGVTATMPTTDADFDGLADNWEIGYWTNITAQSFNGNPDGDTNSDGSPYTNIQEFIMGTNPALVNQFPKIDNFENTGIIWIATGALASIVSTRFVALPSINNSLHLSGIATGSYYVGFTGADISDITTDWSQYSSLKFMSFNGGQMGDQLKIQLTDKTGTKWEFAQVMNQYTVNTWNYFTVVLSANLFTKVSGTGSWDLSPSATVPGVTYLGLSVISKTATGTVDMYVDNFELATQPTSNDTDGDGLPGDWEATNGLNDFSAASPNGSAHDPDHDGYSNLEEFSMGFDPLGRNPYFPMIDDFGDMNFTKNPTWNIAGVNPSISGTPGNYALTVTGSATGNYVIGYASTYIGNSYFDYTPYKYFKMVINNRGDAGDKIKIEIFDNHALTWNVNTNSGGTSEKHVFEITLPKGQKELDIPFTAFAVTGNSLGGQLNLAPSQNFPGIMMIGIAFIAKTATGSVAMDLSNIGVTATMPTTDADFDGLADNWEIGYWTNIAAQSFNGNPDNDFNSDTSPYTNLQEFIMGTNPTVANQFPKIDNFENTGIAWTATGALSSIVSTRFSALPSINNALRLSGTATGSYYVGFTGADISDITTDWSQYSSLKFMSFNGGQMGDQLKIQLTDKTGTKWEFAQVMNQYTVNTWNYFTVVLSANLFTKVSGTGSWDLSPSATIPGVTYLGLSVVSKTSNGVVELYVDNFELATQPTSNDTDGDGLPGDWELLNSLNDFSIANPNGATHDPDGDGYSNFDEFVYGTDPHARNPYFPMIDDFEDGNSTVNPIWSPTGSIVMSMITSANGAIGNYSVRMSASTTNYYAGIATAYIGNPYLDWSQYGYVKLMINNHGHKNDILRVSVYQNEAPKWGVSINETDALFEHDIPVVETANWNEYIIPYNTFIHANPLIGNNTLTGRIISSNGVLYPGVLMVGLSLIHSSSSNVNMSMDVDILIVTNSMNAAGAGDGLPYAWKRAMGLDPNDTTGINAASADPDGDGYTNLQEYQNKTNPLVFDYNPNAITMNLKAGFNLVSLPTSPNLTAAQLIAAVNAQGGSVASVYGWDIVNSQWQQLSTQQIFYGRAYLVACNTDSLFLPPGTVVSVAQPVVLKGSNYNFFGVNVGGPYTAKTLLDEINAQGGNATTVYALTSAGWVSWKPSFIGITPFNISRLKGYVVYTTLDSTWTAH